MRLQQLVELRGIDSCGDWVVCRQERRDTPYVEVVSVTMSASLLVMNGRIKQLIVLVDREEQMRLRGKQL